MSLARDVANVSCRVLAVMACLFGRDAAKHARYARTLIRPFGASSPEKGAMVPMGEGKHVRWRGHDRDVRKEAAAARLSPLPSGEGLG